MRRATVTGRGMAATSHPLATRAAVRALEDGATAVDAAVAAAAVLCVCEPMSTGVGGDLFALVWDGAALHGLNASGRAPAGADPEALAEVPQHGPMAVTVPGAVSGWAELLARHGRWDLGRCLGPAIDAASRGFAVTPVIAEAWGRAEALLERDAELAARYLPAPAVGQTVRLSALAATLKRLAAEGPDGFYRGPVARAIAEVSWLEEEDLAAHRAEWVEPLRLDYRGTTVCELPPNGQGAAALQALALAEDLDLAGAPAIDRVHLQAEALKLAFADAYRYICHDPLPAAYLDPGYLAERRALIDSGRAAAPAAGRLPRADTVYLCTVDSERRACSLIQSLYGGFGALLGAPGTGVALQNRAAGFTLEPGHPNRLAPGRRPFHTIIPGMLLTGERLLGPFGLMGGHMQPQGHLQLLSAILDRGLDPQQALAEPRFRLDGPEADGGWTLRLEPGLWPLADRLAARGHRVVRDPDPGSFGGGQAILVLGEALVAGSEPRKDGLAAGH